MKRLVKAIMPASWVPPARRVYETIIDRSRAIRHPYRGTTSLTALKCAVAYNQYGGYCVPEAAFHRPAARLIRSGKVYEPETLNYMIANCGNRDIIHAGTFFGDFLPAISQAIDSTALIWAFEPNPESYRCAKITLDINGTSNVRLDHAGLGSKASRLFVETVDRNGEALGGASRIVTENHGGGRVEPVKIVAIDDSIPDDRDIGLLQLDVEGFEKEALEGALRTIGRCLPILILEIPEQSGLEQSSWFTENILRLGYKPVDTLHGNTVYSIDA